MDIITYKKIKIYPNKIQRETFDFWFRRCKVLYNVGLEEKIEYYKKTGKYLNVFQQKKELVDLKDYDNSWNDIPNKALSEIIFRLDKSFKRFFKGNGFPKYKKFINSIEFVKEDIRIIKNELFLPKIKSKIKYKEEINKNYTSIRLIKDGDNYFLTFIYKNNLESKPLNKDILGIDLGLKSLYTDSNGKSIDRFSLKLIKKYRKRIDELNKSLSKKKRGSKRRKKVLKHLRKAYKSLSNNGNDYLHKKSLELVKCKESIIALGDIKIQKIINKSNKGLIKGFYNSSLGKFKQFVSYKSVKFNKKVIMVDERNTSKTCSCCGNIKSDLKLSDRIYSCLICNNSIDRDHNSAVNMKLLGSSILTS